MSVPVCTDQLVRKMLRGDYCLAFTQSVGPLSSKALRASLLGVPFADSWQCERRAWKQQGYCWQHSGIALDETPYAAICALPREQWETLWVLHEDGTALTAALEIARLL